MLKTPVLFFIFNRPAYTRAVFRAIRDARPAHLLVVSDGPREGRPKEAELCAETRAIINEVDWPCEVITHFSPVNLGCGTRLSSGISWAFERFERLIILEDDCLPHPSFFRYCETLLERYATDERVMHIGGTNFQCGRHRGGESYFFSRYLHVWGWATWRRAWKHYDFTLEQLPRFARSGEFGRWLGDRVETDYWKEKFDEVRQGRIDTWDYQWVFSCWTRGALAIHPQVNLVSNIGFGPDATHTTASSPLMNNPTYDIGDIRHPPVVQRDVAADLFSFDYAFDGAYFRDQRRLAKRLMNFTRRARRKVKRLLYFPLSPATAAAK